MKAGRPDHETFVRSALKPFQALPALSSGASGSYDFGDRGLAISCASHAGTAEHAREAFRLLWNAQLETDSLQCPIPEWGHSPLEHNCSGKHAAFLATSRKMGWPLESYLQGDHPLQQEINRRVGEFLGLPAEELVAERDDCGAPTLLLQLSQMALLYAHLGASTHAELEQISRAMLAHPKLVAGEGRFDTELMSRSHQQVISKGGAEGVQCLSRTGDGLGRRHQSGRWLSSCQTGCSAPSTASTGLDHAGKPGRTGGQDVDHWSRRATRSEGRTSRVNAHNRWGCMNPKLYSFEVNAG